MKKSLLAGAFTLDVFPTKCSCGQEVYLHRRGPVALLPRAHRCPEREWQEAVLRTVKAEESVGLRVTPTEVARMLRWNGGEE